MNEIQSSEHIGTAQIKWWNPFWTDVIMKKNWIERNETRKIATTTQTQATPKQKSKQSHCENSKNFPTAHFNRQKFKHRF